MTGVQTCALPIWFAAKPKPADALKLTYYYHCKFTGPVQGFERHAKFTKLVNVDRTDEAIQKDFRKNTQYEVRRAQKEGLAFSLVDNADVFKTAKVGDSIEATVYQDDYTLYNVKVVAAKK